MVTKASTANLSKATTVLISMFVAQNVTIIKGTLCRTAKDNSESPGINVRRYHAGKSSQIPYKIRSQPLLQREQEAL